MVLQQLRLVFVWAACFLVAAEERRRVTICSESAKTNSKGIIAGDAGISAISNADVNSYQCCGNQLEWEVSSLKLKTYTM